MSLPPATPSDLPPSPFFESGAPPANAVEARIVELRAEAEATENKSRRAALLYEAAHLVENGLKNAGQAVSAYLTAFNLDNQFRLPLYALLRMFERRRSSKNLRRLYEAQLKAAGSPQEASEAHVDMGVLSTIQDKDVDAARKHFEQALEADASNQSAALLLEANRRAAGDPDGATTALAARADHCDDPATKGLLLLELSAWQDAQGDVDGALGSLKAAASQPGEHETALVALARYARTHQRVEDLVSATQEHAELLAKRVDSLAADEQRAQEAEQCRARAVALWYEASRLHSTRLSDAQGALSCLERAFALRPDDVLLRQTRMLAYDLLEDRHSAAEQARALLDLGVEGDHAASLHFRLAELSLVEGDPEAARQGLAEAISQTGGSAAADAMLDDLLLDEERHADRVERLLERGRQSDDDRAGAVLLKAALIAAYDLKDPTQADALFDQAIERAPMPVTALREAYAHALITGDPDRQRRRLESLLSQSLDEDERGALLLHQAELQQGDEQSASLARHLSDPAAKGWFAHLVRFRAAQARDWPVLADSHRALAEHAPTPEDAVAHLCGAARALARGGQPREAATVLKQAVAKAPTQRYALTMLEEMLRADGEAEEVVALLRQSAAAQEGARDAELGLLLAGAVAEGADDTAAAAATYEQAADRNPESLGPLWALLRLGQRSADRELELKAREGLAQREKAEQRESLETLLLAEQYDLIADKPELAADALQAVLKSELAGVHAAASLSLLRGATAAQRQSAVQRLLETADGESPVLWRELTAQLLSQGSERAVTLGAAEQTLSGRGDDRLAVWANACLLNGNADARSAALEALAAVTVDDGLATIARAGALRERRAAPELADVDDDLKATGLGQGQPVGLDAARVVLDNLSPGEATPVRVQALEAQRAAIRERGGGENTEVLRALARAQLGRGEALAAADILRPHLESEPDDLAAWEALRVAGRRAGYWEDVAEACDRLAEHLEGELQAQLLEEGAAVRMDFTGDDEGAEQRLRQVLKDHPKRPIAYGRLHDLLAERDSSEELLALVQERTSQVDDPEELTKLFYELARLNRSSGDLDGALDDLDNLLMLESDHVGGLALCAEIHSSRGHWDQAVEALTGLADADVPRSQKRLARFGAADFLDRKLQKPERALEQLRKLEEEGFGDSQLYLRIADLCERARQYDDCLKALRNAAANSPAAQRLEPLLRAARLQHEQLDRASDAASTYREVLKLDPGHLEAVTALAGILLPGADRDGALAQFEEAVREELANRPLDTDALRKLRALGSLREDSDLQYVAAATLAALGEANAEERTSVAERRKAGPGAGGGAINLQACAPLWHSVDSPWKAVIEPILAVGHEIDQLDAGKLGVGRSQRVSPKAPHEVRDEIKPLVHRTGRELGDFYVGGADAGRVVAYPKSHTTCFVMGDGISAPLSPRRRFQVAQQAAAVQLGTQPLLGRTPTQAARMVYAALYANGGTLPRGADTEGLAQLGKSVSKALPRKVRKLLPGASQAAAGDAGGAERTCQALARNTRRLALLLGGDLQAALEELVGAAPTRETVRGSEDALDLVEAWTSTAMADLRRKLGMAL